MNLEIKIPESLTEELNGIRKELLELKKNLKPHEQKKYLSRKEVATMLQIDLSTLFNWTYKRKILKAVQIGGRVYYKYSDIESAIIELKP